MFENDGKGTAAYLWVIPPAKAGGVSLGDNPFSSESFDLQLACEIPNSISTHWQNWPFASVGEIDEGEVWHYFHGVRIYMRSFDGVSSSRVDLIGPPKDLQPLRWQAFEEISDTLDQLFGWKKILVDSRQMLAEYNESQRKNL
ncbi:hypothetical protein EON80_30885 [bacterium]|nr:MAG: hypothetical protein EON80_30885 [bacterium]